GPPQVGGYPDLWRSALQDAPREWRAPQRRRSGEVDQSLAIALAELLAGEVAAVLHHRHAPAIDRLDRRVVGREQPGVEQAVSLRGRERGLVLVQHHEVRTL